MTILDSLSATTIVVLGLLLPVILALALFFLAPKFFRRFRVIILLMAAALEVFLLVQVGPLFL